MIQKHVKALEIFDQYKSELGKILPKMDLDLATQIMYYQRRHTDTLPHVHLLIRYEQGANLEDKVELAREKYHVLSAISNNKRVVYLGKIGMEHVQDIASQPDIEWVEGHTRMSPY